MTTTSIKLKLAALAAVLTVALVAAIPADAIIAPRKCGTVSAKGKKWPITADQISCTTTKKWAVAYLRSFTTPRYYKCKRAASSKIYRVCDSGSKYDPKRTFFIFNPR